MGLKKMLREVFSTEGEERMAFAKEQFAIVLSEFRRLGLEKENMGAITLEIVRLFVRVDKRTSYEEYSFLSELFGVEMPFDEFRAKMHKKQDEEYREVLESMVKKFSRKGKKAFCYFGLCIIESDEIMDGPEMKLMEHIVKALHLEHDDEDED